MLTIFFLTCLGASAEAQFAVPVGNDAKIEGSKQFFYEAESYYNSGDYVQAFHNLARAWELTHNPAYAYDAALTLWRYDEPFGARTWLKRVPNTHPGYRQLMARLIAAIDEDNRAWHYESHCNLKTGYCGWGTNWPREYAHY